MSSGTARTSIDQFEVLETLGTGSFGTVCKIKRKNDKTIWVWKEINFGTMSEKEKSQLVAEVNILKDLKSPYIVQYVDRIVDKPNTRLYIIMEHCAGGDLGKLIKRCIRTKENVDEAFIWKIFAQSLIALKDCHRRKENGEPKPVLHRDLKPANILLDLDKNVKIGDFGLAKELSNHTRFASTNVGTPYYMAPEIINEKSYDERSDIWSLGCVLYELAALRPPFDGSNAVSLAMRINAGKISRLPVKYSTDLFNIIHSMLQVEPKRRPKVEELELTSVPAFQQALAEARQKSADFCFSMAQNQHMNNLSAKTSELAAREEKVAKREADVQAFEKSLKEKELYLKQWEEKLKVESDRIALLQKEQQQQSDSAREARKKRMSLMSVDSDNDLDDQAGEQYECTDDNAYQKQPKHSTPRAVPAVGKAAPKFTIYAGPPPPPPIVSTKPKETVVKSSDAGKENCHAVRTFDNARNRRPLQQNDYGVNDGVISPWKKQRYSVVSSHSINAPKMREEIPKIDVNTFLRQNL